MLANHATSKELKTKIINCDERCTIHKIIHIKLKLFNYFDGNYFKKKEIQTSVRC